MARTIIQKLKGLFNGLFSKKSKIKLGIYGEPNTGKTTLANKISEDWLGKPVGVVSEMPHTTRSIQKVEHVEINAGSKTLVMNLLDMPGLATQIDFKDFKKFEKVEDSEPNFDFKDFTIPKLKKIAKDKDIKIKSNDRKADIIKKIKKEVSKEDLPEVAEKLNISPKKSKKKKYNSKEAKDIAEEATKGVIEAIRWLDNVDSVIVMMDSTKDPLTQVNIMLLGNLETKGIPVIIAANKTDLDESKPGAIKSAFPQHPVVPISAQEGENLEELYNKIAEHV